MFDRASIVRPFGRSSIHTFRARAPSRRAVISRFLRSAPYTRLNSQSGGLCTVRRRCRERPAARRAPRAEVCLTFFRGAGNLPIHLCFNCRRPGHRMAEYAEPRTMLVCYNCGRLEVTMRTCPCCGPTHSGFLTEKKEAAVVSSAQASDSRVDLVPVRAVEAAACSVGKTETTPADTPARRKKCRRSKKK